MSQKKTSDTIVDAAAVARFEQARDSESPASIESCLPGEGAAEYRVTLVELILIDLEFGWKVQLEKSGGGGGRSSAVSLQGYVDRFAALQDREVLSDLVVRALCLSQQMGDHPDVRACLQAHPGLFKSERELLSRLAATGYSLRSPTVSLALTRDAQAIMSTFLGRDIELAVAATVPQPALSEVIPVPSSAAGHSDFDDIPDTVGNYRLDRELGAGGMGRVYRATDLSSGQEVALKLVLPQLVTSQESMERFRQEGRLAGGITHPRCVFVLAADQDGRFPYIVMEFVPGTNLHAYVALEGPLEQDEAIRKIIDVIDGLSAAHQLGVIHRDVKPANCLVDDEGRVKVGDFGLSRTLTADVQLTQPGVFLGTPQYCAPEQIRNDPLDDRCDVYSVVATLYFTLTGQAPFHGSDALATMARAVSDPAPPLRKLRPDLSHGLEKVIAKGLERDPKRRWQSMQELKNALTEFLPGQLSRLEQGGRCGAFWVDNLIVVLLSRPLAFLFSFILGERFANSYWWPQLVSLILMVTYFTLLEGIRGTTPGKHLCRLRIQVHGQGGPPSVGTVLLRSSVLFLFVFLLPLIGGCFWQIPVPDAEEASAVSPSVSLLRLVGWLLVTSTMRASNGYRGLHEILSGTCVRGEKKKNKKKKVTSPDRESKWLSTGTEQNVQIEGDWPRSVGAYQVTHAVCWDGKERILAGRDQELGRSVWVRLRDADSPLVSRSRGQVDRNSRLRWLSSGTLDVDHFDVFLAPSGRSLDEIVQEHGPLDWSHTFPLLKALAEEIQHSIEDGTLPDLLSTHQVWLQSDGTVLLIDFATSSEFHEIAGGLISATDCGFALLGATAVRALEGGRVENAIQRHSTDDVVNAVIPMSAREALRRLFPGRDHFEEIAEFQQKLAEQDERSEQSVGRGLRAKVSLVQPVFALIVVLIVVLAPELSGVHVDSWIERLRNLFGDTLLLLLPVPLAVWSLCFPGGWTWRYAGVQVVDLRGSRVSRLRAAWRTWLVWFPFAVLLFLQTAIPADWLGSLTIEGESGWVLWVVLSVIYLLISLIWPRRGPQDVLAGTYLVPR